MHPPETCTSRGCRVAAPAQFARPPRRERLRGTNRGRGRAVTHGCVWARDTIILSGVHGYNVHQNEWNKKDHKTSCDADERMLPKFHVGLATRFRARTAKILNFLLIPVGNLHMKLSKSIVSATACHSRSGWIKPGVWHQGHAPSKTSGKSASFARSRPADTLSSEA